MPLLRSAGTAAALAAMLHANHENLGEEALRVGAEALAHMCNSEDFRTSRVRLDRVEGSPRRRGWGLCLLYTGGAVRPVARGGWLGTVRRTGVSHG